MTISGARDRMNAALPYTVGGWPLAFQGGSFLPPDLRKGGLPMSTSEVFQLCMVIIGIIGLFFQANKKK